MSAPDFTSYFLTSASAGGALVGLLFVAVSVTPGRNVGPGAPPARQAVAASAFTALINAFFLSLAVLIDGATLGGVAITVSAISIIATLLLIGDLFQPRLSALSYARHVGFILLCLLVYGLQFFFGLQYLLFPQEVGWAYSIAYLLLAIYGMGLTRAWQLLGAKRRSVFSWFSPLNDLDESRSPVKIVLDMSHNEPT